MALINCSECGSQISDKADVCVKCGCPVEKMVGETIVEEKSKKSRISRIIIMFFLAFIIAWGYAAFTNPSDDNKTGLEYVFKQITNQPVSIIDKELQIQEDHYRVFPVELNETADITIEYNIASGPGIDIYFMDSTNYEKWVHLMENGTNENIYYNTELSTFGLYSNTKTQQVEAGSYYIVLDNTDYGATYPPFNLKNDISTLDFNVKKK
ncbi:hypothetical protein [Neobacillus bataviensis]|uniref:hypothetical protein n=1 Tax=Neobacillus bataviensis TaxID=220685 RepID=UPI001CBCA705|nr:hypothetical protein [Neobacillus bataviensis]